MALYDDIGGAPAVRAALDTFYPRVLADATLSPFFLGVDIERLKKTQGVLCHGAGWPQCLYGTKPPGRSRTDEATRRE